MTLFWIFVSFIMFLNSNRFYDCLILKPKYFSELHVLIFILFIFYLNGHIINTFKYHNWTFDWFYTEFFSKILINLFKLAMVGGY